MKTIRGIRSNSSSMKTHLKRRSKKKRVAHRRIDYSAMQGQKKEIIETKTDDKVQSTLLN